jgi:hypothetical protein
MQQLKILIDEIELEMEDRGRSSLLIQVECRVHGAGKIACDVPKTWVKGEAHIPQRPSRRI